MFWPPTMPTRAAPSNESPTLTESCRVVVGAPKTNAWVTVPLCGAAGVSPWAGSVHVTFAVFVPAAGAGAAA